MRIGYFGDGRWAQMAFDRIVADERFQILFVSTRHRIPDQHLRDRAERHGIPFLTVPDVNDPAFVAEVGTWKPDLLVSMSFDQILRRDILTAAPLGFVNCHAGSLPFYRGCNPINWAIINGEPRFGVTVHFVDDGIDTGDIVLQRFAPIAPEDTYADCLTAAHDLCAATLHDALVAIAEGTAERTPQAAIHPVGFYCGRRRDGDEWVQWTWPSRRIVDFCRAITLPGPCARSLGDAGPIAVVSAEMIPNAPSYLCTPGEVIGRGPAGVVVKTGDGTIRVTAVADVLEDGSLGEIHPPRFRIGTRIGFDPAARLLHENFRLQRRMHALEERLDRIERYMNSAVALRS